MKDHVARSPRSTCKARCSATVQFNRVSCAGRHGHWMVEPIDERADRGDPSAVHALEDIGTFAPGPIRAIHRQYRLGDYLLHFSRTPLE
jgi:hypothetical protein